jgi:hypothetical protein
MAAGALYDLSFGLAMLFTHEPLARWLALPLPAEPLYVQLSGLLLLVLGALYALPAYDPSRYRGVVAVAGIGRLLGALFLALAWRRRGWPALLGLALGDLALGAVHLWLLRRATTWKAAT